jgi:hypothetical protein
MAGDCSTVMRRACHHHSIGARRKRIARVDGYGGAAGGEENGTFRECGEGCGGHGPCRVDGAGHVTPKSLADGHYFQTPRDIRSEPPSVVSAMC